MTQASENKAASVVNKHRLQEAAAIIENGFEPRDEAH
jgi:hypothetical protein